MKKEKEKGNKILIIVPAYNEEDCILSTYNSIVNYNKKNGTKYDVIVINDGSSDNTESILVKNSIPHIRLIQNLGIGGAVQTGYKYAFLNNYDIAVQFDGDGQHDVGCIKKIIEPILNNKADMCIGSRFINKNIKTFKSSLARRLGIRLISLFIKLKTHKRVYDTTSGFRAINKKIIKRFAYVYPLEYPEPISTTELLLSNYKICEVPVVMKERTEGKSSIHTWKSIYYMINVILTILLCGKGDDNEQ